VPKKTGLPVFSNYIKEHLCAWYVATGGYRKQCSIILVRRLQKRPGKTSKLALMKRIYIATVQESNDFISFAVKYQSFISLYPMDLKRQAVSILFLIHLVLL
jgi:hypothetical protein